ncbi:hypothetical protein PR202_gb24341 [Eleusine coracana subsp. coracana]|uniref:Uncharacterized protein n=1 Tax=Eleusine coracana subsp. coracana TaxID=191504 RepID=A0AAV5FKY3_ELECO|nr:hypothetical protein PR202_gb24341 [Eleusine coracana subsp. coracana]
MAQAAVESALSGDALIGRASVAPRMKRKTPSELRGEQLKRRTNEKPPSDQLPSSAALDRSSNGLRNTEQQKISKFISTRVTEMFPVKKPRNIGKENLKDALQNSEKIAKSLDAATASNFASSSLPCGRGGSAKLDSAVPSATEATKPGFKKVEKCSENALRSVSELHVGDEKQTDSDKFDMEKALKGFGARDASVPSRFNAPNAQVSGSVLKSSDICASKITIPGKRAPLDFSLKTTLQFVSSSSVKWCHKLSTSFGRSNITGAIAQSCQRGQSSECPRPQNKKEFLFSRALQSWVYPQSVLPSSIISAMLSSSARGENDFLLKRHEDWEDSFQNLYYMLRKNMLNMFYVKISILCALAILNFIVQLYYYAFALSNLINHSAAAIIVYTTQFVALFIAGGCSEKKQSCSAYLSQSTRGIRSLLRKHGVCFLMPLCNAEVEQATEDDLIELSEIQRRNLGQKTLNLQALHIDALSDVDSTTQSLLQFTGNESVHGLYDVLLNYK